jgi:hypothetical protein
MSMSFSIVVYAGSPRVAHPILATRDPQIVEAVRRMLLERLRMDRQDQFDHDVEELFGEEAE